MMQATVPEGTQAVLGIADHYRSVRVNGVVVIDKRRLRPNSLVNAATDFRRDGYIGLMVASGEWQVEAF